MPNYLIHRQKPKKDIKKKISTIFSLIAIFFSILGAFLFLFCAFYYPIRWIQNRQNYKLILNVKSNFGLKETIINMAEEDLIKFAKLNRSKKAGIYKEHLNEIWKAFHQQLNSTLKDQFNVSQERLRRLETLKRLTYVMPDEKPNWWTLNWWSDDKYKSLLDHEIAFVKSLQMINKDNLMELLKEIRNLLEMDAYSEDPIRARKCMARKAAESALKEDNDLTRDMLTIMLDIENQDGIPLPFSVIYKRLQQCTDNLKDYESFQHKVQNRFKDILKQSEDRAFILEKVLNEILDVKSYSEKRKILKLIVETVKNKYLFELSRRAWPSWLGKQPLATVLEKYLKKNEPGWAIIRKFTSGPVYLTELQAVSTLINSRYYHYEVISTLQDYTEQMKADADVELSKLDRLEKIISELAYYEKEYIKKKRSFFGNEKATLNILRLLLTRWNYENNLKNNSYELDKMRERIENYFIRYCKKTKRPREGDCYGVVY